MGDNPNNRLALVDPVEELSTRASLPVNTAKQMQVTSEAELEQAGEIVRVLKDLQDAVNKHFDPHVKDAYKTHKNLKNAQNDHLHPLQEAEAELRSKMNVFLRAEQLKQLAAAAARQKAEENLKQQPAVSTLYPKSPLFSANAIDPPKLPEIPAAPKAEGVAQAVDWKWRVVDASLIPADYWMLDEGLISQIVRIKKGDPNIPGIEVYSEPRAVVRR